jgi:hypothetical protein
LKIASKTQLAVCAFFVRGGVVVEAYAASRMVAGSRTNEVNVFFFFNLILPAALGPGFTQSLTEMSTRSRKIMFLGSRARALLRADKSYRYL